MESKINEVNCPKCEGTGRTANDERIFKICSLCNGDCVVDEAQALEYKVNGSYSQSFFTYRHTQEEKNRQRSNLEQAILADWGEWTTGGGCLAYGKVFEDGLSIMVSDSNLVLDEPADSPVWVVGVYNEDELEEGWFFQQVWKPNGSDFEDGLTLDEALTVSVFVEDSETEVPVGRSYD